MALTLLSGDRAVTVESDGTLVSAEALLEATGAGQFRDKVAPATAPARPRGYYEPVEAAMRGPNPTWCPR